MLGAAVQQRNQHRDAERERQGDSRGADPSREAATEPVEQQPDHHGAQ